MRLDFSAAVAAILLGSTANAATIKIVVGKNSTGGTAFAFSPNSTTAAIGDELQFHFYPKNHDVVQGPFSAPCSTNASTSGFYSGFMPTTSGEAAKTFTVKVNDTKPIWFYCSQTSHCQSGMVGVINPPTSGANTLEAYATAAKLTTNSTTPATVSGGVLAASSSNGTTDTSTSSGAVHITALRWTEMAGVAAVIGAVARFMV